MSHKNVKWEKYVHLGCSPTGNRCSPENTADIDSNRPDALEKCIDDSLSSKNSRSSSCLIIFRPATEHDDAVENMILTQEKTEKFTQNVPFLLEFRFGTAR